MPSGAGMGQLCYELLGAFLDFDDLIREEAVGLAMYCRGCFFARSLHQAKDLACAFIEPVFQVLHALLGLDLKVLRMSAGNCFSR